MLKIVNNKKGNIPVTLLVLMSILLAAAALFTFVTSGKIGERMADARFLNKVYLQEEEISFYVVGILKGAVEKTEDSENFESDLKQNFLEELSRYKKNGEYVIPELSQLEGQVGNIGMEDDGVVMKTRFEFKRAAFEEPQGIVDRIKGSEGREVLSAIYVVEKDFEVKLSCSCC